MPRKISDFWAEDPRKANDFWAEDPRNQRNASQKTIEHRQPHIVHESKSPRADIAGKMLIGVVLGTMTALSQQVWLHGGDLLIEGIDRIPFLPLALQVPFLRGVISLIGSIVPDMFGLGLWLLINCSQCGKELIKLFGIRHPWWVHQLTEWSKPQNVAIAYIFEFALNFDKYPIYKGGLAALWQDLSTIDPDSIIWINIPFLLISLLCFEWTVKFFVIKTTSKNYAR